MTCIQETEVLINVLWVTVVFALVYTDDTSYD